MRGGVWRDSTVLDSVTAMTYWPTLLYSNGRLHAVYSTIDAGDTSGFEVYTRHSDDYGLTWSPLVALSTVEGSQMIHSLWPSAYVDAEGHVMVCWYDYKYGSYCGVTGDILARVSTDNGDTWLPESRLTYTQSGMASSCLIINDELYAVWDDALPNGCNNLKIKYSTSSDWGVSWTHPEIITGPEIREEQHPLFLQSFQGDDTLFHCFFDLTTPYFAVQYMRNITFLTDRLPLPINQEEILKVKAYQDRIEEKVVISYDNPQADEVELSIYNINGQRIWNGEYQGKEETVIWDAKDMAGCSISSGTYFVRATTRDRTATTKITYLK